MADEPFVMAQFVRSMLGLFQIENVGHEADDDSLLFAGSGNSGSHRVIRANRQGQYNLIHHIAANVGWQFIQIRNQGISLLPEFLGASPLLVGESKNPVAEFWLTLNPLDQRPGTGIRPDDQQVARVPAMPPSVGQGRSYHCAAQDHRTGGQHPEKHQKDSVNDPDTKHQRGCSDEDRAQGRSSDDVPNLLPPPGHALGSIETKYAEQDVPNQQKAKEQY